MVRMLEIEKLREAKASNPGLKVVSYIKSTLESIAESDYCWTSDKALAMLSNTEEDILFTPNTHFGQNLARWSGKKLALLGGYCPPHVKILAENVKKLKGEHPNAVVLAHPECRGDVVKLADEVLSSEALVKFVRESREEGFIIATELGLIHRLTKENPDKKFYPASTKALCQNMKLLDLGAIYWSLKEMVHRVRVPEETASKACKILEKTLLS
jgi:quinolinate synthase